MKFGMNLLLWTAQVDAAHDPLLAELKQTGYDGVEVPIFEGTSDDYQTLGSKLRDLFSAPQGRLHQWTATHP